MLDLEHPKTQYIFKISHHIDDIKMMWLDMVKYERFDTEKFNTIKIEFKKLNSICENDFFKNEREEILAISNEIITEIEKLKDKKVKYNSEIMDKILEIERLTDVWLI